MTKEARLCPLCNKNVLYQNAYNLFKYSCGDDNCTYKENLYEDGNKELDHFEIVHGANRHKITNYYNENRCYITNVIFAHVNLLLDATQNNHGFMSGDVIYFDKIWQRVAPVHNGAYYMVGIVAMVEDDNKFKVVVPEIKEGKHFDFLIPPCKDVLSKFLTYMMLA